jgi:hypothetical protein
VLLKGKNNIIKIMALYPELADKWIADERRSGNTFFPDVSYEQLLTFAKKQRPFFDLEKAQPAYSCHCN